MIDVNEINEEINPLDTTKIVSGKMLRRDFIYDKRRDFLSTNSIELLNKQIMDSFGMEAKSLYAQDGMYKITMDREKILKATYIGEY